MWFMREKSLTLPTPEEALPGRAAPLDVADRHAVTGEPMRPGEGASLALFGMGCFWGAERLFWRMEGVLSTQVGYGAGFTPNPTYEEVCSGRTGHNEVVRVQFDPARVPYADLLRVFFEGHDPTQGMRQGNDRGTQYRSGVYAYDDGQLKAAEAAREAYQTSLSAAGYGAITTEILAAPEFYYAEDYHQQYLAKNPGGYCGMGGTGVSCPMHLSMSNGEGGG